MNERTHPPPVKLYKKSKADRMNRIKQDKKTVLTTFIPKGSQYCFFILFNPVKKYFLHSTDRGLSLI